MFGNGGGLYPPWEKKNGPTSIRIVVFANGVTIPTTTKTFCPFIRTNPTKIGIVVFGNEVSYTLYKKKNFYKINTPSMLEWFCLEMGVGNMLVI